MNIYDDFLDTQLTAYLSLREALGFQIGAEKTLLPEFVAFIQAQNSTDPIRACLALDWACSASTQRGASGAARRLSIARRFLTFLQASAPDTEVPSQNLLPSPRRTKPYIFTPNQLTMLFDAARASRPRASLRPVMLSTLIGLLASTGLRIGEAIRLQAVDVKLDLDPAQLYILETKFHKSLIVPLHPSTVAALRHYTEQRASLGYDGLSESFLLVRTGTHIELFRHSTLVQAAVSTIGHSTYGRQSWALSDVVPAYLCCDVYAPLVSTGAGCTNLVTAPVGLPGSRTATRQLLVLDRRSRTVKRRSPAIPYLCGHGR